MRSIPSPGGVINVRLTFDNISPSLKIPIPSLLALPSKPIDKTIFKMPINHPVTFKTWKADDDPVIGN